MDSKTFFVIFVILSLIPTGLIVFLVSSTFHSSITLEYGKVYSFNDGTSVITMQYLYSGDLPIIKVTGSPHELLDVPVKDGIYFTMHGVTYAIKTFNTNYVILTY
jgi:hypothetical protein